MTIPRSAWEQTQYNLVQDFLDLFLPPHYTFSVETSYPKTASMEALIENRFSSLDLPEPKLLRLGELLEESCLEDFPHKQADLFTLYAYNVLEGFGHGFASNLQGADFEGLNQLATTWGLYLAREVEHRDSEPSYLLVYSVAANPYCGTVRVIAPVKDANKGRRILRWAKRTQRATIVPILWQPLCLPH